MRDLKTNLTTSGKGSTNTQTRRGKSFGYQVLGFGAGGGLGPARAIVYDCIAGGGSGKPGPGWSVHEVTGGSGGGGFISNTSVDFYGGSTYTLTVGSGGGSGATKGVNSTIVGDGDVDITALGGGYGGDHYGQAGSSGGSGGGGGYAGGAGAGTADQGNAGSASCGSAPGKVAGGGGGKGGAGGCNGTKGTSGSGATSSIPNVSGTFSVGGEGNGPSHTNNANGGANTGDGANAEGDGGSGRIHLKILTSEYTGVTTGSPAVSTDGSYTILQYTGTGTYKA